MAKKIYVDGLGLVEGHFSGIGQYILGVLRGIDELIEETKYSGEVVPKVVVIIPRDTVEKFQKYHFKNITYRKFPLPFRYMAALWHRGWMPPLDLIYGRGVYIFPRFVGMPLLFSKSALVIYDLSYELYRQYSDEQNARFLSRGVPRSLKRASHLIAISENGKQEIADFYKVQKSKIAVASPATDESLFYRRSPEEIEEVKHKYGIKGDYILALSNLEPRKNLDGLIDAYCSLPKSITDKYGLLLVGVNGWKIEALFKKIIQKIEEGYNIMRPAKYVTDEDKPAILSGAKMLVYPSHYEGFGMPPLEALACGTPVVASDNSSLPEAVGDGGILVPSTDTTAIAQAIKDTIDSKDDISTITARGEAQARKYSWRKSAATFLSIAKGLM